MIEAALWLAFSLVVIAAIWWFVLMIAFMFDWSARRTVIAMVISAVATLKMWWDHR